MNDRQTVEEQIRQVLESESDAISLSERLFDPSGLFNRLAKNEADRRAVTRSPLFKEAQKRLSELQRQEAEKFANAIEQSTQAKPGTARLVKIERT